MFGKVLGKRKVKGKHDTQIRGSAARGRVEGQIQLEFATKAGYSFGQFAPCPGRNAPERAASA